MKTAITLCQVAEALGGPFVFRSPLPEAFASAAAAGFDAVELFLPGPDFISINEVKALAETHQLDIAAIGTGAGMLRHGLSITDASEEKRNEALDFILAMIDFGGALNAPAILGSMQGRNTHENAFNQLADGLRCCGERAATHGVPFIYEPLNRYETNLFNRLKDAAQFIDLHHLQNVVILADLFHMNIEETDLAAAIKDAARHIGHVHFADSNRQAMGFGHTNPTEVMTALREIGYRGYLSAEILPLPDPLSAALQTIKSIQSHL
jgi:sugar phosphate isomerase/epimerase